MIAPVPGETATLRKLYTRTYRIAQRTPAPTDLPVRIWLIYRYPILLNGIAPIFTLFPDPGDKVLQQLADARRGAAVQRANKRHPAPGPLHSGPAHCTHLIA